MSEIDHELGRLSALVESLAARINRIDGALMTEVKSTRADLKQHIVDEEERLKHIEEQLSLGRFLLYFGKALLLTAAAVLAFKLGDIKSLWLWLKSP